MTLRVVVASFRLARVNTLRIEATMMKLSGTLMGTKGGKKVFLTLRCDERDFIPTQITPIALDRNLSDNLERTLRMALDDSDPIVSATTSEDLFAIYFRLHVTLTMSVAT